MARLLLKKTVVEWVIEHFLMHGDTDIFPHPFEFAFLRDFKDEIADELSHSNLNEYRPSSMIETLAPKSRYGFRIAHQISPIDALIFTSAVVHIGRDLENARHGVNEGIAFSYRFQPDKEGNIFKKDCKYCDWLINILGKLIFRDDVAFVVKTDISDFYQRIYHHRLENCIDVATNYSPFGRFIMKCIKDWRARQSFGLPVGGNAARLLAEALLSDTDMALQHEGFEATRYVDDFVIFIKGEQDPYAALTFLAEHLATNEGLSLSAAKTQIFTRDEYYHQINTESGEDSKQAEESALENLYWRAYSDQEGDPEALSELHAADLAGELAEEIARETWDSGKIRILLRALRLTKGREAAAFIRSNFDGLLPFVKDIVLLIDELQKDGDSSFDNFGDAIIDNIVGPIGRSLPLVRAWLLELFVRGVVPIQLGQMKRLESLHETLDQRQILILRGRLNDVNYFRRRKHRMDELNEWVKPAFIVGAMCLPKDEYDAWLNNLKGRLNFPLSPLFCKWALDTRRSL